MEALVLAVTAALMITTALLYQLCRRLKEKS
jgi:hypothetical protein